MTVPLLPRVTVHVNVRVNGHFFVRDILYLVNRKKKNILKMTAGVVVLIQGVTHFALISNSVVCSLTVKMLQTDKG